MPIHLIMIREKIILLYKSYLEKYTEAALWNFAHIENGDFFSQACLRSFFPMINEIII